MKKIILLLSFSFILPHLTFSQKIVRNEIDGFTGKHIIETSWESLIKEWSLYSYSRLRKIDEIIYFDFKLMTVGSDVYAVKKGDVLYIKFDDGDVMKLNNSDYHISNLGEGAIKNAGSDAMGVYLTFTPTNEQLKKLQTNTIEGVRLYTTDGYFEAEVKKKNSRKHKEAMNLIKI